MTLLWDLDNLPPEEDPALVAAQLLSLARALGSPRVHLVAAGNTETFDARPAWFRPPRTGADGIGLAVSADGSVKCPLCGRREKSQEAARRHFKASLVCAFRRKFSPFCFHACPALGAKRSTAPDSQRCERPSPVRPLISGCPR